MKEANIKPKYQRDLGLDITRILAFIFVVSVHFFGNTEFYATPILGKRMMLMTIMRTSFMVCVPLFMLLSGYLISIKTIMLTYDGLRNYYKKLLPLMFTYTLCILLIVFYINVFGEEHIDFKNIVFSVTGFIKYSWYVNMYIGLFLLMPFLNFIWNGIKERRGHSFLIFVFAFLTVFPGVFNTYDLVTPGAFLDISKVASYTQLVPDWWIHLYPITYYFLGAYIRKYVDLKNLSTLKIFMLLTISLTASGIYNIWRSKPGIFNSASWNDWGSLENTVNTVLVFLFINSIRFSTKNNFTTRFVGYISSITFPAYLISWIADSIVYKRFNKFAININDKLIYFPIVVFFVVIISLLIAAFINEISSAISKFFTDFLSFKKTATDNVNDFNKEQL